MNWKARIRLETGDVALADTEAIVNAANNELWMGSGVAGAIKRAGGAVIEQEAVRQGPIAVGESVITSAGTLPALHVIHAAAMAPGRDATVEAVRAATASALALALQQQIESISLPALGTGVGGLSLRECAAEMLGAAREHCLMHTSPKDIRFVLYGDNAYQIFREVLGALE